MSGDDFWGNDTNRTPRHSAPLPDPYPRRNLFDFLRFNRGPVDASQPLPLQPRPRNFSLFTGRTSVPTVDVAPAQDVEVSRLLSSIFASPQYHCNNFAEIRHCSSD
ncbi:hypothetical protein AZE42_13324 [Rhizopogon vesiculosus]|uniref:Uncharacterized protein n=1 Tax=Rhizopogon vesiculosus TaxID=180088 RepID=A0A1J8PYI7_9AGAM|nr:hypothetical protein AZE42_13324 [Rhizopogon vesiculosus]